METFVFWLGLHFCVAAVGTWLARRYALSRQLLDEPGERRSHAVATPRGGGISIVVALLLAALWLGWRFPAQGPLLAAFCIGLVLIAGIGWWDDHRPLSPGLRLAVHAIAACQFAGVLWWMTGAWPQAVLSVVAILVLVNVWNFMDGIDGIATSQAAIASLAFAFWLPAPWAWIAGALFAACCGFLPFNFPKARIFLGDVGSGALGYALAVLWSLAARESVGAILLLLPMAVFLVDATFTLASRMLAGERWWMPHVSHVYQRMARRKGHVFVTSTYFTFSGVALLLMWLVCNVEVALALVITVMWYLGTLAWWGGARKQSKH